MGIKVHNLPSKENEHLVSSTNFNNSSKLLGATQNNKYITNNLPNNAWHQCPRVPVQYVKLKFFFKSSNTHCYKMAKAKNQPTPVHEHCSASLPLPTWTPSLSDHSQLCGYAPTPDNSFSFIFHLQRPCFLHHDTQVIAITCSIHNLY